MAEILIENLTFEALVSKAEALTSKAEMLSKNCEQKSLPKLLDNQGVCKILGISTRTLQTYRQNRLLPFTIIRHKIFYEPEHVEALLESSYHPNIYSR